VQRQASSVVAGAQARSYEFIQLVPAMTTLPRWTRYGFSANRRPKEHLIGGQLAAGRSQAARSGSILAKASGLLAIVFRAYQCDEATVSLFIIGQDRFLVRVTKVDLSHLRFVAVEEQLSRKNLGRNPPAQFGH
jgi:hypothetical protein